jgi:ABC-type multidrug transport system fused ATPase/permease subunit
MNYFKRLIKLSKPFWKTILAISILILLMSGLRQVEPIVFKRLTDDIQSGLSHGDFLSANIINLLLVFLVVKIAYPILNRASWYLANIFSYRLRFNLREYAYEHLMSLPISYFNANQSGKLMNQIERGATQLTQIINNSGMFFLPNLITAIIGLFIMGKYSLPIALTILGIFIPVALVNYWKFVKNQDWEKRENELYDTQYGHFWETVSAVEIIKSFVAESFELGQFKQFHQKIFDIRK